MKRAPWILSVLAAAALAPSALAQTFGTATQRSGCTAPAHTGSIEARPLNPLTYAADAAGVVVVEMESHAPTGNWEFESSIPGYAGTGYFRWDGPNLFTTPGVDILPFRFVIPADDTYLIRIHNRHDNPTPDQDNDCWARVDGGPWLKLFHNTGTSGVGVWNFNARYEETGEFPEHFFTAGTHTLEISGRSNNFIIDRVHILPKTVWFAQLSDPQSERARDRPVLGDVMRVRMDDPTNAAGLTPGVARTYWFGNFVHPNFPCGLVKPYGEVLIALSPAPGLAGAPVLWQGPGIPAVHSIAIPNDLSLLGTFVGTQGVFLEPGKVVLTDAIDLLIGDV